MNNPFTVEETNLMCVFETSNRMKLMEEIRRVMLHIKDSDMAVSYTHLTLPTKLEV